MAKGKFIVFEGIDGSGKSTQIKLLYKYLTSKGVPCYTTFEPTDSPFGSLIRQCLSGRIETDDKTIAGLFVADRLDHLYNAKCGLIEKINSGITVLCDRYYLSSYAYHGAFMDMNMRTLFPYAAIFVAFAFVTMFFVRHGDAKPEAADVALSAMGGDD